MNERTGKYYRTGQFVDYKADVEYPLPMIYQSGYLTLLAADYLQPEEETGTIDYWEVR